MGRIHVVFLPSPPFPARRNGLAALRRLIPLLEARIARSGRPCRGRHPHGRPRLALPDVGIEAAASTTIEMPNATPLAACTKSIPSHLNRRLLFGSTSSIRERSNRWLLFESSKGICGGLRGNYLGKRTQVATDFALPPSKARTNPRSGERRSAPEVGEPLVEIQNGGRGGCRTLYTRGAPRNPSSIALMAVGSSLAYVSRIRPMADRSAPQDPGSICHTWRSAVHVPIRMNAPVYREPTQ